MEQLPQNPAAAAATNADPQQAEAQRAQEEQMRRDLMTTILEASARERLSRISLVSPERSTQIETILVRMAQSGQLRGRVSEQQLIDLLDQLDDAKQGSKSTKKSTIVYQRRTDFDDDFDL